MKKVSILFCFILLRLLCVAQDSLLAIKNVSVIDVKGNKIASGQVVIIKGNKIVSVNRKPTIPKGSTIVDATGKFLIPGLWDMHAHTLSRLVGGYQGSFPMLVANGITGVREMGNSFPFEELNRIRREVSAGTILGPRFGALTGKLLDGPPGAFPISDTLVRTPEEGRQLVRTYKEQGADFIKAYVLLSREVYLAIIDEAKRQSLPVAGHVPFSMSTAEVSDLGQISIEHIDAEFFISCSRHETELRKNLQESQKSGQQAFVPVFVPVKAVETYDEQIAQNLFARLRKNGTWMCPTLGVYSPAELVGDDSKFLNDSRLKYVPPFSRERWHNVFQQRNSDVATLAERRARHNLRLKITGTMHRSGVRLLAGSDRLFPGFSLHEELELLVEAGLSPIDALRTATINPALFLEREREFGTVDKGKVADLVLLDANPLEDISNTRKIYAVILNGKLLQRSDLENLLRELEERVKK